MNAEEFERKVGRPPRNDDLERVNCVAAGDPGHWYCGWCREHDLPRFECGCPSTKQHDKIEEPNVKKETVLLWALIVCAILGAGVILCGFIFAISGGG